MKTLIKFKKTTRLAVALTVLLVAGCSSEYIERSKFKVETVDGKILTFACPVLNLERSSLSYIYDGDCVITEISEGN